MIKAHIIVENDHSIKGIAPAELPAGEYDVRVSIDVTKQIDIAAGLKSAKWGSPNQRYNRVDIYQETETKWDRLYGHWYEYFIYAKLKYNTIFLIFIL